VTHCKYILPDGRPIIAIVPGTSAPKPMIVIEITPGDALWSRGQRIPGTARWLVLAERACGL
jgi:hypothetical protein